MNQRYNDPYRRQRGDYGQGQRDQGPGYGHDDGGLYGQRGGGARGYRPGGGQGPQQGPQGSWLEDHRRYGQQQSAYGGRERHAGRNDYLPATSEGYGDIDDDYLPPAWDEAGPQHGGYRNTFASDTTGYGYGGFDRGGEWGNRPRDEYPRGFAGYGSDREGRLQGPYGVRRDHGERQLGQGYGSPSGGASWGGPSWNDPQHRDYQADYGRRQYARSPTEFMGERYPYGHDYGAGPSHYRKGPKGYQRSDQRITEDVSERLSEDPHIDASEIEVGVQGGIVTLKGTVPARYMKHLAEDCADRCFGVKDVENRIRVEIPADQRDDDLRSTTAGAGTFGTTQESRH
ncbi:BON domain-containing protein [Dyella sp. BiH032]|uniref:BON domain-containing protein n=1 Tax=Dyella sp. BiH032 TaxID=3075430 RepID=UPI002893055A|nr:BON domain-containing protein [Dyella sp. BiH032]WNL44128.1 BON domain-containing protein [Dyella sp. BiH032]